MIRGFEAAHQMEAEGQGHMQWGAAVGASLIAGAILLVVPRGSPWSSVTFFSPLIMGRPLAPGVQAPLIAVCLIHMGVGVLCGLIISRLVTAFTQARAILAGGAVGLLLYLLNLLAISLFWPQMRGNEVSVVFTHLVFGLVAAGAYRGLLKRKTSSNT